MMDNPKNLHFIAICQYYGKDEFLFYTPAFVVNKWHEVDSMAKSLVKQEWAKISSHPPPEIIDILSGFLSHNYTK